MRGYRVEDEDRSDPNFPFIGWGISGVVGVAGTALLGLTLGASALNFTAFLFGGIGLVVSVVGFAFTIWQLRRTERATDVATAALERARKEFATLDVLTELHGLRSTAEGTREHLLAGRWQPACSGYDRMRDKLMRIIATAEQLRDNEGEEAKDFVAHILGASGELEQLKNDDEFDASPFSNRLKELENYSLQVEYRIKDEFRGS